MNNKKTFFLKGHKFLFIKNITLNQIIEYFDYQNAIFIVEYNDFICKQNKWKKIKISMDDRIEVISIVGGG